MAQLTAGGVSVARDSAGVLREVPTASSGTSATTGDLDTQGNPVPTHLAHTYTYDTSGNLATDRVTDGSSVWVRTLQWGNGVQTGDSGWVKQ